MGTLRIEFATAEHLAYCQAISDAIAQAAQDKDSGLALRAPGYIAEKILAGNGVIALDYGTDPESAVLGELPCGAVLGGSPDGAPCGDASVLPVLAGFCYIQPWEHGLFVAHSGLIVLPQYRGRGLASAIKQKAFDLTALRYPQAKVFGLTTSPAVRRINTSLGYREVPYSEITADINFWKGCCSCVHYATLCRNGFESCRCTAMLHDRQC